ncbi:MAG: Xaa-Pro dipeptidyl-peptidase [Planctomycetota bacterium]
MTRLLALVPVAAALAAALVQAPATAQGATATKAAPVFRDGEAQVVPEFQNRRDWIREELWVEAPFDSDGDGHNDRLHVDVTRPGQTDTEGLKVPVIYETSPYFAGIGSTDSKYFWDPHQELGAEPPKRTPMPPVRTVKRRGGISNSLVTTWVPRGFAVVHSESPGTGQSQGCPTIGGDNEALAPKAVIDWLNGRAKAFTAAEGGDPVVAAWCTGKVGMTGTSYNGTLPIAAATTGVPGLECVIPVAPNTSYYHYYRSNGLVRHPGGYMGEDVDVLYDFINSGDPDRRDHCNEAIRRDVLQANQDRATGDWNAFWQGRDYVAHMQEYKAATLIAHGLNDWNVMPSHSTRVYQALKQMGVPHMIYLHQGEHGGDPTPTLMNRWFTRYLYGVENGVEDDPRAWIVRDGERNENPTPYPDWPHPDSAPVTLHPQAGGSSIGGLGPIAAGGATQAAVPEKLVDDARLFGADLVQKAQDEHRLLYATPALDAPVHLSGTARVTLRLASSKPATNLSVWVVSLPWEPGAPTNDNLITRGWADPQNRESLTESKPLVPGEFVDVAFDLEPDDQVIPKGARIGLMVFASDRDFTLWPKPGTELTLDLAGCALHLPVVGGEAAWKTAVQY